MTIEQAGCMLEKLDKLIECCLGGEGGGSSGPAGTADDPITISLGDLGTSDNPMVVSLGDLGADCDNAIATSECRGTTDDPIIISAGKGGLEVSLGDLGAACATPLHVLSCPPTAETLAALPKHKSIPLGKAGTLTVPVGALSWAISPCSNDFEYTMNGATICAGKDLDNSQITAGGTATENCEAIVFAAPAGKFLSGHYDVWC